MATHSSILAWRIPRNRGARWAAIHEEYVSWTENLSLTPGGGWAGAGCCLRSNSWGHPELNERGCRGAPRSLPETAAGSKLSAGRRFTRILHLDLEIANRQLLTPTPAQDSFSQSIVVLTAQTWDQRGCQTQQTLPSEVGLPWPLNGACGRPHF